jgi:hypothetical protein
MSMSEPDAHRYIEKQAHGHPHFPRCRRPSPVFKKVQSHLSIGRFYMSVYFIADIRIKDPDEYKKYLDGCMSVLKSIKAAILRSTKAREGARGQPKTTGGCFDRIPR